MNSTTQDLTTLTISELAYLIERDWSKIGKGVNYAARPYLDSMKALYTMRDEGYGYDMPGQQIAYFLSNATSWRGEVAKAVKLELKRRSK